MKLFNNLSFALTWNQLGLAAIHGEMFHTYPAGENHSQNIFFIPTVDIALPGNAPTLVLFNLLL